MTRYKGSYSGYTTFLKTWFRKVDKSPMFSMQQVLNKYLLIKQVSTKALSKIKEALQLNSERGRNPFIMLKDMVPMEKWKKRYIK